ncbi:MAG: TadE/TadG family type IV pilus assembly protein [Planctomycetota bacterium]
MVLSRSLSQRGAALTEFALLVPGVMLMIFCLLQYGLLVESSIALDQAAESASRALLVQDARADHPNPGWAATLVMAQVTRPPYSGPRSDTLTDWALSAAAARARTQTSTHPLGHVYRAQVTHDATINLPLMRTLTPPFMRLQTSVSLLGPAYNPPLATRSSHAPQPSFPRPRDTAGRLR